MRKQTIFTMKDFKKDFAIFLLSISTLVSAFGMIKCYNNLHRLYSRVMVITEVNYNTDEVVMEDSEGFTWSFYGCEDWFEGDVVAVTMNTNGTDLIFDDSIIKVNASSF